MSILSEALRRARGDGSKWARTLGATPAVAPEGRRSPLLPWLLCALLVALVVGLVVYIVLVHDRASQRVASSTPPVVGAAPKARLEPSQATVEAQHSPAPLTESGQVVTNDAAIKTAGHNRETAPPEPQAAPEAVAGENPAPAHDNDTAARPLNTEAGKVRNIRTAPAEPVTLAMLPADVRRDFPPLNIVAHIWNADPELRFIFAGGHQRRVGDQLADGVRLVEITRRGVIVTFRGYRIRLR